MKISNAIVAAGLWAVSCSTLALSLGGSQGSVVLGAPIDLAFEVQPDPGSDVASSCISARLVSGSIPIAESKVQVIPVEGRGRPMVRVRAFVVADEPVLTATLTAGCNGQTTRHYTFLAELPDTAAAAANRPVGIARLSPAQPSRQEAQGARSATADRPTAAASGPRSRPARTAAAQPAATAAERRAKAAVASAAPQEPKPRLVVEPLDLDLWLDAPVALRASSEMAIPQGEATEARRAEAAAWWKALNMSPEEVLQASTRLGTLEADAATLRAQAGSERAAAADLRQRLETVESQSYSANVVYALLALLLLALACAAWVWSRSRRAVIEAWNRSVAASGDQPDQGGPAAAALARARVGGKEPRPARPGTAWDDAPEDPTPTVPLLPERPAVAQAPAAPAEPPAAEPAPAPVAAQMVHPEELFDIQQQAEFFVSVGEHDQAIGVLRKHLSDHGSTSPFAYLELLRLYHTLSRSESFNQLRAEFHERFNARVPEFPVFHRTGRTLEDYPDALAAIEAEWSSPAVLEVIEGCLFRREGEPPSAGLFDLAAYDDLLLLLAIAQTTPASGRGAPPPRTRTTPFAPPTPPAPEPQPTEGGDAPAPLSLDALAGDLSLESLSAPLERAPAPASDNVLDFDLSDAPPLTLSDLPPVPVTAPPAPGQPIGFGMENDKLEVRLEIDEELRKLDALRKRT